MLFVFLNLMVQIIQEGWVGSCNDGILKPVFGAQLGVVFLTGNMVVSVGVGNGASCVVGTVGWCGPWVCLLAVRGAGVTSEFSKRFLAEHQVGVLAVVGRAASRDCDRSH